VSPLVAPPFVLVRRLTLSGIAALGVMACGAEPALTIRDVPMPGVTMPYGLLAVDVEVGDTRGARLVLKALGYIDREVPVTSNGVYVLKMQPADWTVQVVGVPGRADVITFGGTESGGEAASKPMGFPPSAVPVTVAKNRLSNAGHICAHRTCKDAWTPFDHPAFPEWERARRYEEAIPPSNEAPDSAP
jgi:hypothetical protein